MKINFSEKYCENYSKLNAAAKHNKADIRIEKLDLKTLFPLAAQWVSIPNTILNDGGTKNSVTLRVFNKSNYSLNFNSQATIAIDVSSDVNTGLSAANDKILIKIINDNGHIPSGDWNLRTPSFLYNSCILAPERTDQILLPGAYLDIQFSNIVTNYSSGITNFVLNYSGFGGFPDGSIVAPITKSPLYFTCLLYTSPSPRD